MVWGSFSANGRGSLYFVEPKTTVNSAEYLKILQSKLLQTLHIHHCRIFQQDGAPAHTSRVVKQWMSSHGIQVLEWPGNSPDLNPIENLWMMMKRKVRKYQPNNLQDLIFYIKRVWCQEITPQLCQKLVNSMPSRISAVLKHGGYPTKY